MISHAFCPGYDAQFQPVLIIINFFLLKKDPGNVRGDFLGSVLPFIKRVEIIQPAIFPLFLLIMLRGTAKIQP